MVTRERCEDRGALIVAAFGAVGVKASKVGATFEKRTVSVSPAEPAGAAATSTSKPSIAPAEAGPTLTFALTSSTSAPSFAATEPSS